MKRPISKIVLAVFIMSPMTADASLGQYAKNSIGTVLQSIGDNSRPIAATVGGLFAIFYLKQAYDYYKHCDRMIAHINNKEKREQSDQENISLYEQDKKNFFRIGLPVLPIISSLIALASYGLSKACGWAGSKI